MTPTSHRYIDHKTQFQKKIRHNQLTTFALTKFVFFSLRPLSDYSYSSYYITAKFYFFRIVACNCDFSYIFVTKSKILILVTVIEHQYLIILALD